MVVKEDVGSVPMLVVPNGDRLAGEVRRVDCDTTTQKRAERPHLMKFQARPILRELLGLSLRGGGEIGYFGS
jgi:hypothetical protein